MDERAPSIIWLDREVFCGEGADVGGVVGERGGGGGTGTKREVRRSRVRPQSTDERLSVDVISKAWWAK